jgi:hypothetical protein
MRDARICDDVIMPSVHVGQGSNMVRRTRCFVRGGPRRRRRTTTMNSSDQRRCTPPLAAFSSRVRASRAAFAFLCALH